ncbi:MAG: YggU family protein [Syntrophomonadaceae bacterium]|nr:YggU family protein [Syntrophomonadaceae bacterium]
MLNIKENAEAITVEIKVQPRASRNQIVGEQDGLLKVKLTAPPVEGEANQALVNYLASVLDTPRRNIMLIKGETSRNKIISIKGMSRDTFLHKIGQ